MNFKPEDLDRGYKDCECGKRFILEAGTDYPDECWVQCEKCFSFVIDLKKQVKKNDFVI